ncbi:unnamed protein product [Miscanthus lutarioriparius]|uniref:Uncharacterized protein n=1 Tax=Miscanthus lutarioriparius TaxID=422564 RepID=A0A811QVD5_9POAL|nr:unnamed protein product [Miscanthus lutarioriparius]
MPKGRGGSLLLGGWDVTKQTSLKNAAGGSGRRAGAEGWEVGNRSTRERERELELRKGN